MAAMFHCLARAKRLFLLAVLFLFCLALPARAIRCDATAFGNGFEKQLKEEQPVSGQEAYTGDFALGEEGRIGLFVGNNPVNNIDPLGLAWYDYLPWFGVGIRQAQGEAAIRAQLASRGYGSIQEFQLDHPGYGGTMTAGNVNAARAGANLAGGALQGEIAVYQAILPESIAANEAGEALQGLSAAAKCKGGGGKSIGLGLDADLGNHIGTGAITYENGAWQQAGLTSVPWWQAWDNPSAFMKAFQEAAGNAGSIRFDVSSFMVGYSNPGITQRELDYILSNPSLLQKTTFIQNGQQVIWNGTGFVQP